MRERLIKLLESGMRVHGHLEYLADYLLANGAIILPELKHRQNLYIVYKGKIKELEFSSYQIRPEFNNLIQIHAHKNGFNWGCNADELGKTVFLTKEEAEQALKERF